MAKVDVIQLPNIRRLFIPDPGFVIIDSDLSGADAQVVAWEAEDDDLKDAFKKGLKLHIKNVRDVFPEKVKGWSDDAIKATDYPGGIYHSNKRAVHGSNYGAKARTLATILGWTVAEAEDFQRRWFGVHPGILRWHTRTEARLLGQRAPDGSYLYGPPRSVSNRFGYRIIYFDRPGAVLPQALAWVPQSTVALVCRKASIRLEKYFSEEGYDNFRPLSTDGIKTEGCLLQVHDSLVYQIRIEKVKEVLPKIKELISIPVPYENDPLTIPWGFAASDKSWGDASKGFLDDLLKG